jgi:hypothetical protein
MSFARSDFHASVFIRARKTLRLTPTLSASFLKENRSPSIDAMADSLMAISQFIGRGT